MLLSQEINGQNSERTLLVEGLKKQIQVLQQQNERLVKINQCFQQAFEKPLS